MGGSDLATQLKAFDETNAEAAAGAGGRAGRQADLARGEEREHEEDARGEPEQRRGLRGAQEKCAAQPPRARVSIV